MITNLHLTLTSFRNESRVLKETATLLQEGLADRVHIAALHEGDLPTHEQLAPNRVVSRLQLKTRSWPKNLVSQFVKYIELTWRLVVLAREQQVGLVNVHSLALLPAGALIKLLSGARLVYDAHELETEAEGLRGLRKRLAKSLERAFVASADLVVVVSPGIERWYRQAYGNRAIVTVLNTPRWRQRSRSDRLRDRLRIGSDRRIALYQGGLTPNRGIEELIATVPVLSELGYDVVLMGYGVLEDAIRQAATRLKTLHYLPAVPPQEVLDYTASADLGISWIVGSCLSYRLSLPNKLFEYVMAGLPVLVSDLPEMRRVVEDYDIGAVVPDWTPEGVVAAVRRIDAMRGPELDARLETVAKQYNWEVEEAKLVAAYRQHILPRIRGTP